MIRYLAALSLGALLVAGCSTDNSGNNDDATQGGNPDATAGGNPDATTGTNPDATDTTMDATAGNPDASAGNPDATAGNPDATAGNRDATAGNPDATAGNPDASGGNPDATSSGSHFQTVFLILMENHNWDAISGSSSAPYINNTLLPMAAHAENYKGNAHPSEPNYIWLVTGAHLVFNDNPPSANHQSTHAHLAYQMNQAGISWKEYAEDITGSNCPLSNVASYAPKHNPFVFFDDLTGTNNASDASCIAHNRPFTELQTDLNANTVAHFNFISPNLCNDMHDSCGGDAITNGDTWLSTVVPMIMASQAYQNDGLILITWDEGEISLSCIAANCPIGMIALSPHIKSAGYSNMTAYDHNSTLRTVQQIFGLSPYLGAAANATALSDFFSVFP